MADAEGILPGGEKMRQAIHWMLETIRTSPVKNRQTILKEAELRFDLSPRECEFLDTKLGEIWTSEDRKNN